MMQQAQITYPPLAAIFKLVQDIIGTNHLTNHITKNALIPGGNIFQPPGTIFELVQNISGMTKFHEDRTISVASRVLTRKNAPLPGGHDFKRPETFSYPSKIS
ncbi:hypothetical protein DPMN_187764 [Dreissena polymorpha]|uniref:Uncharacterized protein n=1 Tax=Dreissena polymorpha TaxID=45954 RepID=A0A9D4DQ38_DREPO|nr:hypothetical protein DPMN_187764 [Dreissena polymorpha]